MSPRQIAKKAKAGWRTAGTAKTKLAPKIALDLAEEIILQNWPVGRVIGTESDLLEKYAVSRAVLREAIRLLEFQQVATMRRGPGGGLIVKSPDPSSVVQAIALLLDYQGVTAAHLFEARVALELTGTQLAAERLEEAGVETLRTALDAEHGTGTVGEYYGTQLHNLHVVIARLSGNPAISLFVEVLTRLTHSETDRILLVEPDRKQVWDEAELAEVRYAHHAIVDSIIAKDASLARHRMLSHLNAVRSGISRVEEDAPAPAASKARRAKRPANGK